MTDFNQTIIGKTVTFQVYPSGIISDDFTNVTVVGIVTHEAATAYIRPAILHTSVYPSLPTGTPNDYRLYEYALIRKPDGVMTAVGLPWIKMETVVIADTIDIVVTIRGKGINDIDRIRQILVQNNIPNIEVTAKMNG